MDGQVTGYLAKSTYEEKVVLSEAGGRWDGERKCWNLPLDADLKYLDTGTVLFLDREAQTYFLEKQERENRFRALQRAEDAEVHCSDKLDPYQRVGVRFLIDAGSAILADDMGLGKTAQAIQTCEVLDAKRILIVAKKSLLFNWQAEIGKWAAGSTGTILTTQDAAVPKERFVITNYEAVVKHLQLLQKERFDVLIVDEATAVKNRKSDRSKALHKLAKDIPHRYLLTGTPIHNAPAELWSLLKCLAPEHYTSYWRFVKRFCYTELGEWGEINIGPIKDEAGLAKELSTRLLRRTKELLNLPSLSHETVRVPLVGEQERIYNDLQQHFFTELVEGTTLITPTVLSLLTRLRQVVCTPALLGGPEESGKVNALRDILEDITPNHKVLVFSVFAKFVEYLMPLLNNAVPITGSMTAEARRQSEDHFRTDQSCRILIGTIGAMAEGLNLQAADTIIFLNHDWVPATNQQAEARAHRRGQTKPVHVINLVAGGTVDEHVESLLSQKDATVSQLESVLASLRKGVMKL